MKQILTILLIAIAWQSNAQDTTHCSLIKEYKIGNTKINDVVKITYDNELTFYTDLSAFLKFSKTQLNIFKEYEELYKEDKWYKRKYNKGYDDTLYIDLNCHTDTANQYKKKYSLEIRFETYYHKYYTKLTEHDTIFDDNYKTTQIQLIENFYFDTKTYVLARILRGRKILIYNNVGYPIITRSDF